MCAPLMQSPYELALRGRLHHREHAFVRPARSPGGGPQMGYKNRLAALFPTSSEEKLLT